MTSILEFLAYVDDVRDYIKKFVKDNEVNYNSANSMINNLSFGKANKTNVDISNSIGKSQINNGNTDSQKNINININNYNYSNIYLGENYNFDKIYRESRLLKERNLKDTSTNQCSTNDNLFRNSQKIFKENINVKVSASRYSPTFLNSNISSVPRDQSKKKGDLQKCIIKLPITILIMTSQI